MFLENIVFDAAEPRAAGRYWQDMLGCEQLSDSAEGFETRLGIPGGPVLDLCFPQVEPGRRSRQRLVPGLVAGAGAESGPAADVDLRRDPAGHRFTVASECAGQAPEGPLRLAALRLESSGPQRDAHFWAELSGWRIDQTGGPAALRHPSGRGPLLEFVPEAEAKRETEKNPVHLDLRLDADDDPQAVAERIAAACGRELHPGWGQLPWRIYQDPSGNEFCVLPATGTVHGGGQ